MIQVQLLKPPGACIATIFAPPAMGEENDITRTLVAAERARRGCPAQSRPDFVEYLCTFHGFVLEVKPEVMQYRMSD
jgi:hypothetical protein